jgi:acyl-CoA thioesterase FadM
MYPFIRLATTVVGALRADRVDVLDTVSITLPVTRGDVEATRMNNGRYLTLMDLGRLSLTLRGGYLHILAKRRWYPLVTDVMIHFARSLRVGTRFDLLTRIVCWDSRDFFIEQWFEQRGEVCARAFVKAFFMGARGRVGSEELLQAGGFGAVSPPFPESVRAWQAAETAVFGDGHQQHGRVREL